MASIFSLVLGNKLKAALIVSAIAGLFMLDHMRIERVRNEVRAEYAVKAMEKVELIRVETVKVQDAMVVKFRTLDLALSNAQTAIEESPDEDAALAAWVDGVRELRQSSKTNA